MTLTDLSRWSDDAVFLDPVLLPGIGACQVGLRRSDEAHRMIAVQVVRTVRSQIVIVMRYMSGSWP